MTECNPTQDADAGVLWVSEHPWPDDAQSVAWAYKQWSLQPIDAWDVIAELDALGRPWRVLEPESSDPLFYVPAGDTVAEIVLQDGGLFRPFEWFEGGDA